MDLAFSLAERWTEAGEPAGIGGAVEYRTDVFDAASIETLVEQLQRVVAAMTADSPGGCRRWICSARRNRPAGRVGQPGGVDPARAHAGVGPDVVCRAGRAHAGRGGADLPRPFDDLSGARRGRQPVGAPAGRPGVGPGQYVALLLPRSAERS